MWDKHVCPWSNTSAHLVTVEEVVDKYREPMPALNIGWAILPAAGGYSMMQGSTNLSQLGEVSDHDRQKNSPSRTIDLMKKI